MAIKWNQGIEFPKENYVLRCTEESFGPSKSSGNPMITLEFEVQSPDEVPVGDDIITVAGVPLRTYLTTKVLDGDGDIDAEKTENCAKRLEKIYAAFGLDFSNFSPDNPTVGFKGKLVHAYCYAKEEEDRKAPTKEQVAKRQQGDVIKNPITGKSRLRYQPQVGEVYGLAQGDANKPY
jgi:hypothetical protein